MKHTVTVLGEGAWGTAVALLLASKGHRVILWCHNEQNAKALATTRKNEIYFPEHKLGDLIEPTADMQHALSSRYIFEAIPVKYLRSVLQQARLHARTEHVWISLSKGIEQHTLLFPSQIIKELIPQLSAIAVVSGPSFAQEVAEQKITALTVAAQDCDVAIQIQKMVASSYIKPYTSTDMIGVQVGGALKNVISLGIGIAHGAKLSENSKAFLFTRGFREILLLTKLLGGRQETLMGLSGIGDLVMSAYGILGRNRACGELLGSGMSLAEVSKKYDVLPESINTVKSVYEMAQKYEAEMPVCTGIYRCVYERYSMQKLLNELMQSPLEQEC